MARPEIQNREGYLMICETNNEADVREAMHELGLRALRASRALAASSAADRVRWLLAMADALERDTETILAANAEDLAEAKKNGLDAPKLEIGRASCRERVLPTV